VGAALRLRVVGGAAVDVLVDADSRVVAGMEFEMFEVESVCGEVLLSSVPFSLAVAERVSR